MIHTAVVRVISAILGEMAFISMMGSIEDIELSSIRIEAVPLSGKSGYVSTVCPPVIARVVVVLISIACDEFGENLR